MTEEQYKDPDWLYERYFEEQMTTTEMAEEAGVSDMTIGRWMDRHGLDRKKPWVKHAERHPGVYIRLDEMGYQIIEVGDAEFPLHRLVAIAKYGIDAVKGRRVFHKNRIPWDNRVSNIVLNRSEIEHRPTAYRKLDPATEAEMVAEYVNSARTLSDVGAEYGVSEATVWRAVQRSSIEDPHR